MNVAFSLSCLMLITSYSSFSQEYSYTHYGITDGLAGATAYCMTQDVDGFLWIGTETGVSRFDGTHFKTFTVADGLPDAEILQIFADSKGRVWMAPFRKAVCYYYQGRIHNQENDSLLHRLVLTGNIESFAEDKAGNVLVQERRALHLFRADGKYRRYDSLGGEPIRHSAAVCRSASGSFLVQEGERIFTLSDTSVAPFCVFHIVDVTPNYFSMNRAGMIWRTNIHQTAVHSFVTNRTQHLPFEQIRYRHNSYTCLNDSLFYFNETTGATEYNIRTGETKHFLPGRNVSRTFRDATGNSWFTTLGQGIFRLNSDEFKTIRLKVPGIEEAPVFAIKRIGNRLLVGDSRNNVFEFSVPDLVLKQNDKNSWNAKNRILYFGRLPAGGFYTVSDVGISKLTPDLQSIMGSAVQIGAKSFFEKNDKELLISTHWGVCRFDLVDFRIRDTLWHERSTAVCALRDTIYIGTLGGLYALTPDRSVISLGERIPFFHERISALAESADGILWVASYDAGTVGYKDGRIVATISSRQGLTSNICRVICVHGNTLWIGTDKGLNKVDLDRPGLPVTHYTSQDGLSSDVINTIYADSSVVYVGTPSGLSYFDETKVNVSEGCPVYLTSLTNSGKERIEDTAHLVIPFSDKYLRMDFAGISYRSVGNITYRYRILGLDSTWRTTKETFLEYPSLPSGDFEFQLQAINKFGNRSRLLTQRFRVSAPFWQRPWFQGGIFLCALCLTWLLASLRIRHIRRRQKEKEQLNQRMMELEHSALQAQMNPHFIFNCLNSIQQYIVSQEVLAASKYLTGFARLIRATLHHSSRAFISLADEIDYLTTYLSLEKLRFKEKMDYRIEVDAGINKGLFVIPPMLIQPYVENSMRHGLRHKTTGNGYIHIIFSLNDNKLVVTVEDNGIGRKQAAAYKTREHIEYQSRGMSLTADRIRMINMKYPEPIRIEVIDLEGDLSGSPAGTRVIMEFPLFHTLRAAESGSSGGQT